MFLIYSLNIAGNLPKAIQVKYLAQVYNDSTPTWGHQTKDSQDQILNILECLVMSLLTLAH